MLPLKRIVRRVKRERMSCTMATGSINVDRGQLHKSGERPGRAHAKKFKLLSVIVLVALVSNYAEIVVGVP